MNVSKEKVFDVLNGQQEYINIDTLSWSWNVYFNEPMRIWTMKDTEILIKQLSQLNDFNYELEDDTLEVKTDTGNLTLVIKSIKSIQEYCNNEYFENIKHEWIEKHNLNDIHINNHYPLNIHSKINSSSKVNIDESTIQWGEILKEYHQYKRVIFNHKKQDFKIVIEYAKHTDGVFYTMKEADIGRIQQEINIYMQTSNKAIKDNTTLIISQILFSMQHILNEQYILTIDEQNSVLNKYLQLISSVRDLSKFEKLNPKPYFLAPKPITLERKNLIEPDTTYGVVSILKNYAVTDKADGERMLLYVDDNGEVYLINNTFNVKKTGIVVKSNQLHNSLFDGEYIPKYLLNDDSNKDVFAVFDVYYLHNETVMNLPLMADGTPNRYQKMQLTLQESLWSESTIKVEMKEHYHAEGKMILKKCKEILDNPSRRYNIDGLVFTPIDLPVFAYYPKKFKKIKGKSVAWNMVFKWKPADQNTIDFLVKLENDEYIDNEKNKRYKRFKLYTGYNATQWEELPVWKGIQQLYQKDKQSTSEEEYKAKLFKPVEHYTPSVSTAFIPLNRAGQAVTVDGTIIDDSMIVEFSYNRDGKLSHPSMKWIANRVREDKTRAYKKTGSLSKTANDLSVALNIWHNIYEPVTYEHIIGEDDVNISEIPPDIEERLLGTNDVYYAREIPRNHMLSVHMLNFHNYGIKSYLYQYPDNKESLLELACGMAGDLPRWRDNNYKFILGVDLVKDNIESPQGAYSRFINQRNEYLKYYKRNSQQKVHYPQAVFLVGDCALPLENGEAAAGKDYDSEQLLKLLYMGKVNNKYSYLNRYHIPGKASKKFDVVSCQFAIHYFFKSKELLEGFLRNVSINLKQKGKFIFTFMDGQKVHKLINKDGYAKGEKEGNVVWCIQKQYKQFNKSKVYGNMIDVYLENTNKFIPEYLVHFDFLKEKAKEYDLEIVEDGFFEDTFKILKQKVDNNDKDRNKFLDNDIKALTEDNVQTQFSFINRWAIFSKK